MRSRAAFIESHDKERLSLAMSKCASDEPHQRSMQAILNRATLHDGRYSVNKVGGSLSEITLPGGLPLSRSRVFGAFANVQVDQLIEKTLHNFKSVMMCRTARDLLSLLTFKTVIAPSVCLSLLQRTCQARGLFFHAATEETEIIDASMHTVGWRDS